MKPATELVAAEKHPVAASKKGIPMLVRNNPKLLKIWEHASEEEQTAGVLLSDFQSRSNKSLVATYFDFADKWNDTFPKQNKKMYERGMKAVKTGAKLAGVAVQTVYMILKVAKFYGRQGYEALVKKAEANGVIIGWTHLKVITSRLHDNKEARTKVEHALVQQQMTEAQLNAMIDELVPTSKGRTDGGSTLSEEKQAVLHNFSATVTAFRNIAKNQEKFLRTITDVNDEIGDNAEQAKIVQEQLTTLIGCFVEIKSFIDENETFVQQMHDAVCLLADQESGRKKVEEAAKATQRQIAHEREELKKKRLEKEAAVAARGDFTADDSGDSYDSDEEDGEDTDDIAAADYAEEEEMSDAEDDVDVDDADGDDYWDEMGRIK